MAKTEFKLVRKPKSPKIQLRIVRQEVKKSLEPVGKAYQKSLERVVANWNNKPKFKTDIKATTKEIAVITVVRRGQRLKDKRGNTKKGTTSDLWKWMNEGTESHTITANKKPKLRFVAGTYNAKTGANPARFGGPGTISDGQWVTKKSVEHPGFEGRNFTGEISADLKPDFDKAIRNAYRRGLNKAKKA